MAGGFTRAFYQNIYISQELESCMLTKKDSLETLKNKMNNKEDILNFAGRGGIDESKIKAIREGWKKFGLKLV